MGFKFIKTKDENNSFDLADVEVTVEANDLSGDQLTEIFKDFLRGCGYFIDHEE